jgi:hypothetical protein
MDSSLPAVHHGLSNQTTTSALTVIVYTTMKSFFRSGAGGRGEVSDKGGGKMVDNFKYKPGGNMPKKIWLGNSDPGDGFEGSSIV